MPTTDELLQTLAEEAMSGDIVYHEIDPATRTINIPQDFLLGVESDECANRVYFTCPKIVGDNDDLTAMQVRINYVNGNGEKARYIVDDVTESTDVPGTVIFSWLLSREVTKYKGNVTFNVCAANIQGIEITDEWNTVPATGNVLEGLEVENVNESAISHIRGDSFISTLSIKDSTGVTYTPVEGDVIKFTLKQTQNDTQALFTKTIPNDTLKLVLDSSDTSSLPVTTYIYDIRLTKSTGEVYTIIPSSPFILLQEVG